LHGRKAFAKSRITFQTEFTPRKLAFFKRLQTSRLRSNQKNMTENTEKTSSYSYYALALLMFVYVMNFLDRQIIYILFPAIKQDMQFSDLQLSLLGTSAFAIFYTFLGIPFGRMADKGSRAKLIAIGLLIWSLFSGLTGFATGFWSIFFCRVMVGVGEATLGPAAISLLADYFPPNKRATVTSIYSMGIAIGAGLAAIFGGILVSYGWRTAFMIVGFPGVLLAIFVFLLKEPQRTAPIQTEENYSSADWKRLISNKSFILLCLGYAFLGLATNNFSIWSITYLNRLYQIQIPQIAYWLGMLTLIAGIPATLLGGKIADIFREKQRGGRMLYGAILSAISFVLWFFILFTDNFSVIIGASLILIFVGLAWLGAVAADAVEIAGANLRGVAVAVYFFSINIFAYIIGSNLIGYLSDIFGSKDNLLMMRYALLVCPVSCLLATICLILGSKSLNQQD
jgi:MFS family permease